MQLVQQLQLALGLTRALGLIRFSARRPLTLRPSSRYQAKNQKTPCCSFSLVLVTDGPRQVLVARER